MHARLRNVPHRARRLFPPGGRGYELFNVGAAYVGVGLSSYVLALLPSRTAQALRAPLMLLTERQFGWLIVAAGLAAVVLAYTTHPLAHRLTDDTVLCLTRTGYLFGWGMPALLSAWFLIGYATTGTDTRALGSAILYGLVCRGAWRVSRREPMRRDYTPDEPCTCCGGGVHL